MESMSRPLHRRKLSNAYSGVFSGHRPKSDGAPAVSVEEYDEIFSTSGSCSIPVLDLSSLEEESSDDLKPDYCKIFGGFRDHDIAVSYQDLVARDLARAPSSTSQSSSDLDDTSQQCSDALKQFNLSYHKISQRNKDGLDGTTHVTQLHAVPGFTCFIDESASQPNKETVKRKSSSTDNVNVNSSKQDLLEKKTATNNVNVNSRKRDYSDKRTSQSSVDFSKYQEEYLSDNRIFKTFEADLKSHPSKILSSPESKKQNAPATNYVPSSTPAASQSKKETERQKPPATNNVTSAPPSASEQKKETEKVASQQTKGTEKQTPPATNNIPLAAPVASQPKQETEKQKPPATNNVISAPPSASEQKKETEKQTPHVASQQTKGTEKQTPPATNNMPLAEPAASHPKQETEKQKPLATNNVLSAPPAASHPKQETEKQKPPATNNVPSAPPAASHPKQETENQKPPATNNFPSVPTAASQPKQETEKQKPPATNNVPSAPPAASHPKQETEKQKSPATNNVPLVPTAASQPKQETKKQSPSATNKIPSSPPTASQPTKETKKQKSSVTNNDHPSEKVDFPEKQTSQIADESQCRPSQDEAFCDVRNLKEFQADFKSSSFKVSSSRATNLDNHKDHQKRSTTTNEELPPACYDEELHVNPAAAALRKAIEKAQESIRIAKESVGRKKEGLRGFSSKSFKESLKAKVRVANVNAGEDPKEKDHKNGSTVVFSDFADGEKLFGAKDVTKEIHGKVSERSPFILNNNKMVCNSKQVVGETESESIKNNKYSQKDDERPDGFLVLESCEKKQGDSVSNNLTVCQKVETKKDISQTSDQNCYEKKFGEESFENCEKKQEDSVSNNLTVRQKVETEKEISQTSDQNGCEKKLSEESFGLFLNNTQENLEQEHEEKVSSPERQQLNEDRGTESHSEEEKFYDVCEVEMINKAQTYAYSKETNENLSSDYDDAEENENVIDANHIVDDTEEACKVDQNDDNAESSQEIDGVSSSHQFQVEYKNAVEKEIFENISSDETESNKDECEAKSDDVENCSVADVDFGQNDVQFASSSDMIHGMEIEVKEYKEREETFEKEENNVQQSHEETPEIRIEMDTGTPQEPKDACRQSEPNKAANDIEERERERIKLAVERAIREARERAFAEVKQRVIADTQEKVTKAAIDKTSAQSKLRAERALVERATAEARQRALEKVMKTSQPRIQVNDTMQVYSTSQTNTESALRSKAKLEKHNRIMERAAKALAEKEKRDLLALREQAERHRLAEHLDADIKRWSTGKEGNLRALLSTLQYILGADSGWQPVSLTEIITTTAVKKAYRKATLCVHPDKLQQRGASIQQKYICEKVFDLLKAAWNRFNSEER